MEAATVVYQMNTRRLLMPRPASYEAAIQYARDGFEIDASLNIVLYARHSGRFAELSRHSWPVVSQVINTIFIRAGEEEDLRKWTVVGPSRTNTARPVNENPAMMRRPSVAPPSMTRENVEANEDSDEDELTLLPSPAKRRQLDSANEEDDVDEEETSKRMADVQNARVSVSSRQSSFRSPSSAAADRSPCTRCITTGKESICRPMTAKPGHRIRICAPCKKARQRCSWVSSDSSPIKRRGGIVANKKKKKGDEN